MRAKESEQLQGPLLSLAGYLRGKIAPGTLHPNRRGHQEIADRLFQSLAARGTCRLAARHRPDPLTPKSRNTTREIASVKHQAG